MTTINLQLQVSKLKVVRMGMVDADSVRIEVHYNGLEIGHGTLNTRTNWAHIDITIDTIGDVTAIIQDLIEEREIELV